MATIMDFVVSSVTPKGGNRFEITAQTYNDLIYDGAPPHMQPCGDITATLINTGDVDGKRESYVGVYENKILYRKSLDQLVYSDDYGATWTTMGLTPDYGSGFRLETLNYHETSGYWFMLLRDGNTDNAIYRSSDNGLNWVAMTMPASTTYSSGPNIIIDYLGRLLFTSRTNTGEMWLWRWDNPTTDLSITTSYNWATATHNTQNLKELPGFGYAIARYTGTGNLAVLIPYDMLSVSNFAGFPTQPGYPWSFAFNGVVYSWMQVDSGNPRFVSVFNGMTDTPLYLTHDFVDYAQAHRVQAAGDNYLLMFSQPNNEPSVWRLIHSFDAVSWSNERNLLLPSDPTSDSGLGGFNLYKAGGNYWIAHYQDAIGLKLIRFSYNTSC